MAEKSFCFNSINGDRKYKAEDFRDYFASFIGNGVFPNPSNNLQVMGENSDMTITIKAGKGWINGAFYVNDADLILPIDVADGVLNRIDRIVLRLDIEGRAINAVVKKGTFASSPTAPDLQRDADAYELGIADILVSAGATQITQANVTDQRLDNDLCGVVHGVVEQVDTKTLLNQYTAGFLNWFNTIKGQLSTDAAGNLQNQISDLDTEKNIYNAGGTANAITVATPNGDYAYEQFKRLSIKATADNTGNVTINVDNQGAVPALKFNGDQLEPGQIKAGKVYDFYYDTTGNCFFLIAKASGNAVAADVLAGKTFSNDDSTDIMGTGESKLGPVNHLLNFPTGYTMACYVENEGMYAMSSADWYNNKCYLLDSNGTLIKTISLNDSTGHRGIQVTRNLIMWISNGGGDIVITDKNGNILYRFTISTSGSLSISLNEKAEYYYTIINDQINIYNFNNTLLKNVTNPYGIPRQITNCFVAENGLIIDELINDSDGILAGTAKILVANSGTAVKLSISATLLSNALKI